jgi:hypothetical protein
VTERPHPNDGDLYTPLNDEVLELLMRMRNELGSWRVVAWKGETRLKVLRNIRDSKRKAISLRVLDRLCVGTGIGSVDDFPWFTANDLVALGVWEPVQYWDVRESWVHHPKRKKRTTDGSG